MTGDLAPRRAPIAGGGRCDICGNRSFRQRPFGGWRHAGCEPTDKWLTAVESTARTEARRWGTTPNGRTNRRRDLSNGGVAEIVQLPIRTNGNGHQP
jgi:hypothetical protein